MKKQKLATRAKSLSDAAVAKLIRKIKSDTRKYWLDHISQFSTDFGYIGRFIAKQLRIGFSTSHVVYRSRLWYDSDDRSIRTFTFHVVVLYTGHSYKGDFRKRGMIRAKHRTFVFDVLVDPSSKSKAKTRT